eukprot:NODE_6314_length_858_cov_134.548299_g6081_i0.p1 GENE.NODE_6314_length_858_cov_134.548299_g6081_i0~~NODE_6314_length_858_cov_134.548299_g6081_i0.p1  ORF type:complete len:218 (+),score=43.76 NODE_6314_length_858_cov_134.548299_g6081_i0:38-655(+)
MESKWKIAAGVCTVISMAALVRYLMTRATRRRGVVAFDFDRCLMNLHMWAKYQNTPIEDVPIHTEFFGDPQFLQWLIPELTNNGVKVCIATFGRKAVVLKALRHLFGQDQQFFNEENVSSPADHGCNEGWNTLGDKNTQLQSLSQKFGVPLSKFLFFDDDRENVKQASKIGVSSFVAEPLTRDIWKDAGEQWCEENLGRPLVFGN